MKDPLNSGKESEHAGGRSYGCSEACWVWAAVPGQMLLATGPEGDERINRIDYEICVLQTLRERLRCKEIWLEDADRYRNPDDDLPLDFDAHREAYYQALH